MKNLSYMLEAAALWFAIFVFRFLGPENASNLGGWIGRTIGPRLGASRKARKHLQETFPQWSDEQFDKTISEMWDNLGRVMAEYPHLEHIIMNNLDIEGLEAFNAFEQNAPLVTIGSHLANWELLQPSISYRTAHPMAAVYREPNNPYAGKILERCRHIGKKGSYIPKSSSGTRALVSTVKQGGCVGILIDQKYNEGLPVEFFGRPAMTSTAPAQLARKYNAPIIPICVVRHNKTRFRIVIEPAMNIDGMDEAAIMLAANRIIERWIVDNPGQWLWLHRRWISQVSQ